ncbi:hypothetical protein T265_09828 [Opisthorchis viverrini]|uniref:Hemoglobinase n=1 Tax=Opisthorchis viverrini TaxID=6198 RepID=A0A074Z8R7_OPIVI|nr:hypothetical protein T265_09828 [Opisthorchis viverrini]KER21977.1 hypothetical protein T265_09828 [Opisthorchis viverrini]
MVRHCSLLLVFLFCIHNVARVDAVSLNKRSSLFNNQPSKNWVVLAAGSNTWENYRHQADVFHAYQLVRKNNVPPENIITFAYDDIANNPKNPFKGKVFHDYEHEDVYNGVVIDYRGKDVTRDNFVKVLKGDKKLEANEKKVLKSGPDDNVFIFFSGHGAVSHIGFLEEYLYAMELNDTLAYMHSKKMFNKLVLYMEACYSGSMFKDVLPSNMGIYATTSAKEDEKSHAIFCFDPTIRVCLANVFSDAWIADSEQHNIKKRTLEKQYGAVKRKALSHVMKYGEMPNDVDRKPPSQAHLLSNSRRLMEAETEEEHEAAWRRLNRALQLDHIVGEMFRDIDVDVTTHHKPTIKGLSKRDELMCFKAPNDVDRKPPSQAHLLSNSRRLMEAETEEEYEATWRRLHRALELGHIVKETFRDVVMDVTTHHKPTVKALSKRDELICFQALFDQFRTRCFTVQQASSRGSPGHKSPNGVVQSRIQSRNPHRVCPQHLLLTGTHYVIADVTVILQMTILAKTARVKFGDNAGS